jgi:hypothetical protein
MTIFYKPFSIETDRTLGAPLEAPAEEVILERDGIHYINSRFMDPGEEAEKNLDKKFLDLIDSVVNPEDIGAAT